MRKLRIRSIVCLIFFLFAGYLAIPPKLMDTVSFSRAVYDRNGQLLRLTLSQDEKYRLFTPLASISPLVIEATLLHEDQYFSNHPGINPAAIIRAFYHTYIKGSRKIGASTITMQLARITYGIKSRTLHGKLWQMLQALRLELHYSKNQILEAYLNLAPYGHNIEGIGAASFVYFGKSAKELNLPESLTMTVIPQSPYRRAPGRSDSADNFLYKARNRLYANWIEKHPDDSSQKLFFSLPFTVGTPSNLPRIAPHVVNELLHTHKENEINTTIDSNAQKLLQELLSHYVSIGRAIGVPNASALLVNFRTMEVVASIGSADFADNVMKGQVNGVKARRSPGSALKPFIYALAFDQGLIHPMSLLKDSPHSFGDFNPENFDKDFLGAISAHDALIKSRNIPALFLAAQLKNPSFYQFLKKAEIGKLKKEETYGLSLALGTAEVTMEELAMLYATLANDGLLKPLVKIKGESSTLRTRLCSSEAAFLTLDILQDTPGAPITENMAVPVYWKTGTSNSYRDAWTAGIFGQYVLVVWVGDFRGRVHGSTIGIRHAAPLFFAITQAIMNKEHPKDIIAAKAKDLKITRVQACSATGDINNPLCKAQSATWFIPGKSPIADSGILHRILINKKTGKQACHYVEGLTDYKTIEIWPSDLVELAKNMGLYNDTSNLSINNCSTTYANTNNAPKITSPFRNVTYSIKFPVPEAQKIRFSAVTDGNSKQLYWFVDNRFIGKTTTGSALYWVPHPGKFTIRVVDDIGNADTRELTIVIAN